MSTPHCQIGLIINALPLDEKLALQMKPVSFLYLRADLIKNPIDWKKIKANFKGKLVYALRNQCEGGAYIGTPAERQRKLMEAAEFADFVELEGERDLQKRLLNHIPPEKRIISWHGGPAIISELQERLSLFSKTPAKYYQLVPQAEYAGQELHPLQLLKISGRKDLITYASGPVGLWTQMLAVFLGCPMILGRSERAIENEYRFSIQQMIQDYGLPNTYPVKEIYGIAGNPVFASLSPRLHNNTYRFYKMDALFLAFHVESFDGFWKFIQEEQIEAALDIKVKGFTMVSPFKEAAFEAVNKKTNPYSLESKASNVLYKNDGNWYADSTDAFGVVEALKDLGRPANGLKVAIIGCGGAGRTIASALKQYGANITLFNRSRERGLFAAKLLGLPFLPYEAFNAEGFDLVINATPLGKKNRELPFDPSGLHSKAIIIDMAYSSNITRLIRIARLNMLRYVDGRNTLVYQVRKQFELMTGKEMPFVLAEKLAVKNLPIPVN